jgi:hypothetical protein
MLLPRSLDASRGKRNIQGILLGRSAVDTDAGFTGSIDALRICDNARSAGDAAVNGCKSDARFWPANSLPSIASRDRIEYAG